ncbi:hypothetical protein [Streptomyces sp. Wh19]|uniref:hypothetical protein n=1 Tax=Streptomyces sp. Wh19 TaxID=3076629 RepID=UPI002958D5B5|nr:hypothetical protein [Streptomyces sp. Wh19]MDV9202715.1 hypothetical protein [Streptomyces sp. Wh19]
MASSGAARAWVWVTAGLALLAAVGLALVAVLADLDTAGQAASVVGSVVGLAALLVSVVTLFRGGGSGSGRRVRAGRGAVAAGGNITGSALGVDGHVAAPEDQVDVDSWSHQLERGTHRALVVIHPGAGLLQGADPYLRWLAGSKRSLPEVATRLGTVLVEWDDAQRSAVSAGASAAC